MNDAREALFLLHARRSAGMDCIVAKLRSRSEAAKPPAPGFAELNPAGVEELPAYNYELARCERFGNNGNNVK